MSFFEQMVEFDIFYRDWKKCFCPLRISLHDMQKMKHFVIEPSRKQLNIQQGNLALLRRKHGVIHEEESENELEKYLNFYFKFIFFTIINNSYLFIN